MKKQRVGVTESALIQRLNRKLKADGAKLKTARSEGVERDVGRYFIVDVQRNFIAIQHVDLEELGRKLEVLKPWEEVAQ